jgi:hypothetical protein
MQLRKQERYSGSGVQKGSTSLYSLTDAWSLTDTLGLLGQGPRV